MRCTDRQVSFSNQHDRALWIRLDSGEEAKVFMGLGGTSASSGHLVPLAAGSHTRRQCLSSSGSPRVHLDDERVQATAADGSLGK